MATVTPVLRESNTNSEGTAPIYIRISDRDKNLYVSLGERTRPNYWLESKQRVSKQHARADDINEIIRRRVSELKDEIYRRKVEGEEPTADELKRILQALIEGKPLGADFFAFGAGIVDEMRRRGQIPASKRYKSTLKKFERFAEKPLAFDEVTPKLLRDFETYMIEKLGNKKNTRASAFRCIRALYNKAIAQGLASQADYPFFQFKVKREVPVREKLSLDEIRLIEALDLKPDSLVWHVRNYFLFSFYCAGVRFRDVALMRWRNVQVRDGEDVLSYRMSKTGGQAEVEFVPQSLAILDHYRPAEAAGECEGRHCGKPDADSLIFPMLDGKDLSTPAAADAALQAKNALVNKYLKKLAKKAGIEKRVSFHIARHSWAHVARKSGWSVYDIAAYLVHENLRETDRYLKSLERKRRGSQMREMFSDG